ncbi:hypothetical protein BC828DRAFT_399356 [Blastocladiella britannica]|nr:hypothetical protein BC828DRAFT_399356 [Blastocladiella britannica]
MSFVSSPCYHFHNVASFHVAPGIEYSMRKPGKRGRDATDIDGGSGSSDNDENHQLRRDPKRRALRPDVPDTLLPVYLSSQHHAGGLGLPLTPKQLMQQPQDQVDDAMALDGVVPSGTSWLPMAATPAWAEPLVGWAERSSSTTTKGDEQAESSSAATATAMDVTA